MRCIIAFELSIVETCVIPLFKVLEGVKHIAGIDNEIWYEYQGQIAMQIAKLPPEIWENGLCIIH